MPNVLMLPAASLHPHPDNPRGKLRAEDVAELRKNIEVHQQKQPCLVRPLSNGKKSGEYQIVIGHRRAFVAQLLEREVPCLVEDLSDEQATAIMLSDNEVHEEVDPFLQAKAVASLLSRKDWTLQAVADALGKSVSWVARRANLANLQPHLRAALEKKDWPLDWLEDLAKLDPAAQGRVTTRRLEFVGDRRDLDQLLASELQLLGKASWPLDDETLVPKAGSCAACPKTSLRAPGLFDQGEDVEEQKHGLQKAVCRDSTCWETKRLAMLQRQVDEAKASGAKCIVLKRPHSYSSEGDRAGLPAGFKGAPVVEAYNEDLVSAKKGAPDAVLAGFRSGNEVQLRWVKDPAVAKRERAVAATKAREKKRGNVPAAQLLKASRLRIEQRRMAHVLAGFAGASLKAWEDDSEREKDQLGLLDQVTAAGGPPFAAVFQLVSMFEVQEPELEDWCDGKIRMKVATSDKEEWRKRIWPRLTRSVRRAFQFGGSPDLAVIRDAYALAKFVAGELGVKTEFAVLEAEAIEEIPDPKSWKSLEAQAKAGKGKQAPAQKRKGRKTPPVADTADSAASRAGGE